MVLDVKNAANSVGEHAKPAIDDDAPGGKYGYRIGHTKNGYTIPDVILGDSSNRKVKVLTIGAGVSGILMAYLIQENCQNVEHTIYEKNGDIGGTWLEVEICPVESGSDRCANRQPRTVSPDALVTSPRMLTLIRSRSTQIGPNTSALQRTFSAILLAWSSASISASTCGSTMSLNPVLGTKPKDSGMWKSWTTRAARRYTKRVMCSLERTAC
jgi:hypothetical protein